MPANQKRNLAILFLRLAPLLFDDEHPAEAARASVVPRPGSPSPPGASATTTTEFGAVGDTRLLNAPIE